MEHGALTDVLKDWEPLCWGTQVLLEQFWFHLSGTLRMINLSKELDLDAVGGCVKGQTAPWCGLIDSPEAYSFYGSFTAEFRSTGAMKVGLKWCREKKTTEVHCCLYFRDVRHVFFPDIVRFPNSGGDADVINPAAKERCSWLDTVAWFYLRWTFSFRCFPEER